MNETRKACAALSLVCELPAELVLPFPEESEASESDSESDDGAGAGGSFGASAAPSEAMSPIPVASMAEALLDSCFLSLSPGHLHDRIYNK